MELINDNQTLMSDMNTHPFTIEEYQDIKETILPIKEFIPDSKLDLIWSWYMRLENRKESRPCSCGSAAKYWKAAVLSLRYFINKTEEINK